MFSEGTRLSVLIRHLRPDGSPLRRRVDRIHGRLVIALIISFLTAGPFAAAAVAHLTYGAGLGAERREAGARHQVDAVVLTPGSATSGRASPGRHRSDGGTPQVSPGSASFPVAAPTALEIAGGSGSTRRAERPATRAPTPSP